MTKTKYGKYALKKVVNHLYSVLLATAICKESAVKGVQSCHAGKDVLGLPPLSAYN